MIGTRTKTTTCRGYVFIVVVIAIVCFEYDVVVGLIYLDELILLLLKFKC